MAYTKAVDIWVDITDRLHKKHGDLGAHADDAHDEMLETISKMKMDEAKRLAEQYADNAQVIRATMRGMNDRASYRDFLNEIIWVAAMEYGV